MGETMICSHPTGKMKKNYLGKNGDKFVNQKNIDPTPDVVVQKGISRTFQNIRLWKSMTVFENVLVAKHMRAKHNVFSATFRTSAKEEARMREETMELLREQGLDQYKDEIATSLPYGLQRRLEIARALATEPKLLLLDEPAAGMNPNETEDLAKTIRFIRDHFDMTILLIEHDMNFVSDLCDEITVLNFGTVLAEGDTKTVLQDPKVIKAYIGG
jgi:branched-chain amino acid transport system ATP-binding protein